MKKQIIFLSLWLMLACSSLACAAEEADPAESYDTVFTCSKVAGNHARSTAELFSSTQILEVGAPTLTDLSLADEDAGLGFRATFSYGGEEADLDTSGVLYHNEKTARSGMSGNLVLGDMEDVGDWHFVQLRIERDYNQMMILLQNKRDYELFQFLIEITEDDFQKLYELHENPIGGEELERKIISLYSVNRNLWNSETAEHGYGEGAGAGVVKEE